MQFGPIAPQPAGGKSHDKEGLVESEDCLRLNVWTPSLQAVAHRPVLVYFHGGAYNGGSGCTATEQRLVDKSPACYLCMVQAGCVDDVTFNDVGHECGDVAGVAARGAKTGTSRSALCLDTLDCILNPAKVCASTDVNICYCGSLGAGNGCATGTTPDTTAACFQQEVDGLEHLATDAPSAVLPDYTDLARGAGMANQLFVCAKSNGCDALCAQ